jgi:hypothetical protein
VNTEEDPGMAQTALAGRPAAGLGQLPAAAGTKGS